MHITDSPEDAEFRAAARTWLESNATPRGEAVQEKPLEDHVASAMAWQRLLYGHGWAGIGWPAHFGGQGRTALQAAIFADEMSRYQETVGPLTVALGMVAPTLMAHGTPDQQRHISAILRGEELWCQLFSEPGAGSDLASVSTRAVLDGETWIIDGQKVWTSLAQFAKFGILLARTDPDLPKHAGLTYFIIDMDQAGVEVRPLVQMTGHAHFNETFLSKAVVHASNVVGKVGQGWKVARTTLTSERSSIAAAPSAWSVDGLIDLVKEAGRHADPIVRQRVAKAYSESIVLRALGYRLRTALASGQTPGKEALVMKLLYANHWVATTNAGVGVLGADGMMTHSHRIPAGDTWQQALLNQYAIRLGGGTDEVQRNIIGELGLGLPREPEVGRELSWKDYPK